MNKKRAFTLIELLVVIAIIAILAAILFPVFAQAKAAAKKAACISNLKQETLGVLMYNNDFDDVFPLAQVDFHGQYGVYWPQSGFIGFQYPCGNGETDCMYEGNSTEPYVKNYQISVCPGNSGIWNPYGYSAKDGANYTDMTSYTYNGDIHAYSGTAATNPTLTVMFWSGSLNNAWRGRSMPSPALNCSLNTESACEYVPNPDGKSTAFGASDIPTVYDGGNYHFPSYSKWVHGQGDDMSNLDGHAKFHHMTGGIKEDPWAFTGSTGSAEQSTGVFPVWTNAPGGHMCLFGPDNPCGL